ncbi:hypothetical protein ACHAXA_000796 [Cyclostephanos tholiformis]|uniref:Uncharacterized protein n=1 Tax=Cyclostephanos tholiformis TaxID=382380 RepID=A0ABD3R6R2_9STRA
MGATYEKYTPNLYLLTELTSFRWPMLNPDALDSGALGNAFYFTDSDVESEQNISQQIGMISSGGAAPSLADAQQLLKMKINLPGPDDSIRAVQRLHAVCRVVLPVAHPLTSFLGQHYAAMRSFDPGWQTYATPVPEYRSLKGVFRLQWLSLRLMKYFVQHDQNLPVVFAPDPNAIIDSILEQKHGPTAQPAAVPGAPAEAASRNASRAGGLGTSKPVCLAWHTKGQCNTQCPHTTDHITYSAEEYAPLDEFVDMIHKGQWIVLPYSSIRDLPGLRVSPPGVVPQRERRPHWICDYSWSHVNGDTLPLAAVEAMQFGHALDRILREVLLADPARGPIYLLKLDITTETIADLANARLAAGTTAPPHPLDDLAESIPPVEPLPPTCQYNIPSIPRDPALPRPAGQLSYVDVFVDDFVGLAQDDPDSSSNRRRVRRILLHAANDVFHPLEPGDPPERQEPISLNKLRIGDCSWATIKSVLGWIIDTTTLTIHLPSHRVARLPEILASIPRTQRRTSLTKWHTVLGYTNKSPLAWRFKWPQDIINKVVTDANPHGSITNSDLELAGGLLHLDALAHCFDIRGRTVLSKGDNLSTTFWERKGSTTTNSPPAYLLQDWMSMLDADTANRFGSDIRVAQDTVLQGVSPGQAAGIATAWGKWLEFTHDLGLDPFLQTFQDKIPFLQVFAQRIHSGNLAANGNPIKSRSVEDYIRGIAQTFLHSAPLEQIQQARFASLTFTMQKNGVRGKVIGLACSGDPFLCPIKALVRHVLYLSQHAAAPDTPITRVFNSVQSVTSATITSCIREAVAFLGPYLGFLPSDVSARCLRAAGATALLLAQVDPDIIHLIGRWHSDEMLRYLHVQAYPLMSTTPSTRSSSSRREKPLSTNFDWTILRNAALPSLSMETSAMDPNRGGGEKGGGNPVNRQGWK